MCFLVPHTIASNRTKRVAERTRVFAFSEKLFRYSQIVIGQKNYFRILLVCLCLGAVTAGVYWPVSHYELINLDDPEYILSNPQIRDGLTLPAVKWALTTGYTGNWHPLTWLSFLLDVQINGFSPGGMHLTNVALHIANSLLLFLLFRRMTGSFWRSAFISALFALHPLHVESVAWVTERKDVLSTFFGLLSLWAYVRYVENAECRMPKEIRNPKSGPGSVTIHRSLFSAHRSGFYWLAFLSFAFSLMSKAMLVTLPFLLLLLDFWPLRRMTTWESTAQRATPKRQPPPPLPRHSKLLISRLLLEKLPFLVLALAFSVITFLAQKAGGAIASMGQLPLYARFANALMSYLHYLLDAIWPHHLSAAYPLQKWQPWQPLLVAALLAGLTVLVLRERKRAYLLTGWFWFLGTLVPVIGIVQVGNQTMADRFMYFPLVGLAICLAWGMFDLAGNWPAHRALLVLSAAALLGFYTVATRQQVSYWKNSLTLFEHALRVTDNNVTAHNLCGLALETQGRGKEAMEHYKEALRINPASAQSQANLGSLLGSQGNLAEAIAHTLKALEIAPAYPEAHDNVGVALLMQGKPVEAEAHFREAVRLRPSFTEARSHWASALMQLGKFDDAIAQMREALRHTPEAVEIHLQLSYALGNKGALEEAISECRVALRLKPNEPIAHNNLADFLLQRGKIQESLDHSLEALRLKPDFPEAFLNAGKGLFKLGKVVEAVDHYCAALRLNPGYIEAASFLDDALSAQKPGAEVSPHFAEGHYRLAQIMAKAGKPVDAKEHYRTALQFQPAYPEAHYELGVILAEEHQTAEAIVHWREAVRLKNDWPPVLNNLAWILATNPKEQIRDGSEAVRLAERACALSASGQPSLLDTLAAAYAEAGRFADATTTIQKAITLAETAGNTNAAAKFRVRLELYRLNKPYHES